MRLLAASIIVLTGCSAVVGDESGDGPQDQEQDQALRASVSVQRTETASQGLRTHVAARFLRATGAMDDAESMVDAGALDPSLPLGCAMVGSDPPSSVEGPVELLDVGEIVLHTAGGASTASSTVMALAPRAFPDVGGLVSGVVYTSRDGRRDLPDAATYLFEVTGSSELDGLSLVAEAPAAPSNVRFSGVALDASELVLAPGASVDLTWTASDDEDDRIYVTATSREEHTFTCAFEDDGTARIPGAFLALDTDSELDVMIHRHRRSEIAVVGSDYDVVVDFDFAVAAQIAFE